VRQLLLAAVLLAVIAFRAKDGSRGLTDFLVYGQTATTSINTVTDNRSTNHIFAQVADGRFADGSGYGSTLVVQSDASTVVSCTATLLGFTIPGFGDGQNPSVFLSVGLLSLIRPELRPLRPAT
jgi:hypothetical protein